VRRRSVLGLAVLPFLSPLFAGRAAAQGRFAFPRDHGAHPEFRTEWWYVTGWLDDAVGFQVTFFRVGRPAQAGNPSAFAPRQILLAHAALADPRRGRLVHEERAARAGLSLAEAETERTGVWIDEWRMEQEGNRYEVRIPGREIDLELSLIARAVVPQGDGGLSRKGRRPQEVSSYYSRPQINVVGKVNGKPVEGRAWLDHEWSNAYLAPEASGWDWTGINLADGGSLMAFRMRGKAGGVHYAPNGVAFTPLRTWRSPRTGIEYPVEMKLHAEGKEWVLKPLMDDQEFDARATTGIIYWEGAVRAFLGANEVGRGYLELTGYGKPVKL
jgi:predicted secreted hydrolase